MKPEGEGMAVSVKVIGIRYGYRTPEHEDGPGTDGFGVLQEVSGTRHAVILFYNAIGTEMLDMIYRYPGEPIFAHELFVDLLRITGTTIESLVFGDNENETKRHGAITLTNANGSWTRECGAFDLVGLSIATKIPITIADALFTDMHENSPDLEWVMREREEEPNARKEAERHVLSDDIKKSDMN